MRISRCIFYPFVLGALLILASACTKDTESQEARELEIRLFNIYMAVNYPELDPMPSGLYFQEHEEGTGEMPGSEDWVLVNHVAYTIPDNTVYETYVESVARDIRKYDEDAMYGPYKMWNGSINDGLTEGLELMKEGGKATVMFTSELGFGSKNSGSVGAYRSLKYEIELLEVIGDMEEYEQARIEAYVDTISGVDTIYDPLTDAIMYFVIDKPTDGPQVGTDSIIDVSQIGHLIDGRIFDQTEGDNYSTFRVGEEGDDLPKRGWHLGVERFREGEIGRLIVPFQLMYGESGDYTVRQNVSIPPYETIVYDIEILSVEGDLADIKELAD